MFLKFNRLECPFCGFLSRQNQFFCGKCGCDLKHAKTIPVPVGQVPVYQEMHRKPVQSLLIDNAEECSAEMSYRKFLHLSGRQNIQSDLWQHGREMAIETKNFTYSNLIYFIASAGIVFFSGKNGHRGLFYLYSMAIILYGLYRRFKSDKDGDTIIINDDTLEVHIMNSRNNVKLGSIAWDDVGRIYRIGDDENMRICLESDDGTRTCKLPVFYKDKRTMMLNAIGIMAHKKNICVE